jgi:hypothetical protein
MPVVPDSLAVSSRSGVATQRAIEIGVISVALLSLLAVSAEAFLARLTSIPLGRGSATITWTGATGITPTIKSVSGTAGGYHVSATGTVPKPSNAGTINGSSSTQLSIPSQFPIADVKGTIGGAHFSVNIVLTLPSSPGSTKPQNFGHVSGTFRNQQVSAILTSNVASKSFAFKGTIGTLQVTGVVSQPSQHGDTETARATFDVTR